MFAEKKNVKELVLNKVSFKYANVNSGKYINSLILTGNKAT